MEHLNIEIKGLEMKAFPKIEYLADDRNGNYDVVYEDEGMDLRDYFAIRILQSQLRHKEEPSEATKYAYDVADAMMEARK